MLTRTENTTKTLTVSTKKQLLLLLLLLRIILEEKWCKSNTDNEITDVKMK